MSKWDDIKKSIGAFADKTVEKTKELSDAASLKIKIASKEADRDTEYRTLGKLTYTKLKDIDIADKETLTSNISASIEKLDKINAELAALRAEEEARRASREAEKAAKESEKAAEKEAAEKAAEQEEKIVMDQFNEARKKADEEYKKACDAAKDAESI